MDVALAQWAQPDTIILTATRCLASDLQHRYAAAQQALHHSVWETLNVQLLNVWLQGLWRKLDNEYATVLGELQERHLWMTLSGETWATAAAVQQAWHSLQAWNIDLQEISAVPAAAVQGFYQWARSFQRACQQHHWVSVAELPSRLLKCASLAKYLPKRIILCGFDEPFPPTLSLFLDGLRGHYQVVVEVIDDAQQAQAQTQTQTRVTRHQFANTESEIRHMAAWAQQHAQDNPSHRIACIVPQVAAWRRPILRIFSETLIDDLPDFRLWAGQPLTAFPIIQTAVQALELLSGIVTENIWVAFFQSPYFAQCEDDVDCGVALDGLRRVKNIDRIHAQRILPLLIELKAEFPQSTCLQRWRLWVQLQEQLPTRQRLSAWIHSFIQTLTVLQWPGSRALDQGEEAVFERWRCAIEELSLLDEVAPILSLDQALLRLKQHIHSVSVQIKPEKNRAPAVQIVSLAEAAGMPFDALWVMGLDQDSWPPAAAANPFLPHALQIEHDMPQASERGALLAAKRNMQRLLAAAPEVVLSSSLQGAGDRPLKPSRLIEQYPLEQPKVPVRARALSIGLDSLQDVASWMESIKDEQALPLRADERIRGGASILQHQALCPFRAYASFRLSAQPLESPSLGLSLKLRGQLLHRALELVWQHLKSQDRLVALQQQELDDLLSTLIDPLIDDVLPTASTQQTYQHHSRCLLLEKIRLKKIIKQWLLVEKSRAPFVVLATEAACQLTVGALTLSCRMDRIDQLESGACLLIDYKSADKSIQDWLSSSLPEPQLPLYCVYSEQTYPFQGIAYGQIQAHASQFKGISAEHAPHIIQGITPIHQLNHSTAAHSWDTLLAHWKSQLESLSQAFSSGWAAVDPLDTACRHCKLQALCRIK